MAEQCVFGFHSVKALLSSSMRLIKKLYINQDRMDNRLQEIVLLAKDANVSIERVSLMMLNQRYPDCNHQGVVALCAQRVDWTEYDIPELLEKAKAPVLILILDGVTDPHNLGAVMRSADATGVDFIVIPKDNSVGITPVVSKVASGAAETIPLVRVTNLARAMTQLKEAGVWLYGAAGEAKVNLYQLDLKGAVGLVMGAEGEGMRRLTREHCDNLFSLPMLGQVSSLNVSVATGVSLYEVLRQRQQGI